MNPLEEFEEHESEELELELEEKPKRRPGRPKTRFNNYSVQSKTNKKVPEEKVQVSKPAWMFDKTLLPKKPPGK